MYFQSYRIKIFLNIIPPSQSCFPQNYSPKLIPKIVSIIISSKLLKLPQRSYIPNLFPESVIPKQLPKSIPQNYYQ